MSKTGQQASHALLSMKLKDGMLWNSSPLLWQCNQPSDFINWQLEI